MRALAEKAGKRQAWAGKFVQRDPVDGTIPGALLVETSVLEIARRAKYGHVVHLVEVAETAGNAFCMVMPRFPSTLCDHLLTLTRSQQLSVARDVATALAWLHDSGIMWRDAKSANIMLTRKFQAVLIDFSLARTIPECLTARKSKDKENTRRLSLDVCTKAYCAPETKAGKYDEGIDAWALGVVFLEIQSRKLVQSTQMVRELKLALEESSDCSDSVFASVTLSLLCEDRFERITVQQAAKTLDVCAQTLGLRRWMELPKLVLAAAEGIEERVTRRVFEEVLELAETLGVKNGTTVKAALYYQEATGVKLLYCLLVAQKLFEAMPLDLTSVSDVFEDFSLSDFVDKELRLCRALNWCLLLAEKTQDQTIFSKSFLTSKKKRRLSVK